MGNCTNKETKEEDTPIIIRNNLQVEKEKKPFETKIVLLGDQNVGKSSIALRFCKNQFTGNHTATIGGAYMQQNIILSNGTTVKYHIWDTGGQERFRSMANLYYRDASAAILTYDVTNEKTFEGINFWVDELRNKCDQDKLILCLAANKSDVDSNDKKVSSAMGSCNIFLFSSC
jgi:small GTP-binding protein